MTRRELLFLPVALSGVARAVTASEPQSVSFPLEAIQGALTPAELFFVRNHFVEPEISLSSWKLRVEGRVERPFDWTINDLLGAPKKSLEAVLECAGNPAGGQSVSNGVWEGVPLGYVLDQARPRQEAASVLFEGADQGELSAGSPRLPYCQIVPLSKCADGESLLAYRLNGGSLPKRNGFPARALIPDWYGMDSVKWLTRIVVLGPSDQDTPFHSSGISKLYNRVWKTPAGERLERLSEIAVKSVIAWPNALPGEPAVLPQGIHYVWGFAWTGSSVIRSVELSMDGGKTWTAAQLESAPRRSTWVRWSCLWRASAGEYILMSRASDLAGNRQPLVRDPARADAYELNWCAPLRCVVS
jgi:DMSO/TMAO reductase YedYZ molybdopterin-dependent catalytic subunit